MNWQHITGGVAVNLIDDADIAVNKVFKFSHAVYDPSSNSDGPSMRPYHCIQFRISGYTVFTSKNNTIYSKPGDLMFIPKGTGYYKSNRDNAECYLVLFNTLKEYDSSPRVIHPNNPALYSELFRKGFRSEYNSGVASNALRLSLLYEIIGNFQKAYSADYLPTNKSKLIEPAVAYFSENFADSSISVGTLADICGISETYFRQLFQKAYGMNPSRYFQHVRINKAKSLLKNGYDIQTVSEMCGFCDSSYFTKVFCRECSILPSEYIRENEP